MKFLKENKLLNYREIKLGKNELFISHHKNNLYQIEIDEKISLQFDKRELKSLIGILQDLI